MTKSQREEESGAVPSGGIQLPKVEEERLGGIDNSVKWEHQKEELYENLSEEGELLESSDDEHKNGDRYWEEDKRKNDRHEEFVHRRRDNDHRDDSSNRNSHSNHDFRYNLAYKSRNRSRNDPRASGWSDRKHGKSDATRQTHDLRSKLNYRSHARPERLRDRSDKYEKRREDRLTRENCESTDQGIKDNHEPRERFDRKYDDRFFYESRNDHDRNYDSNHKRLGKSRSPGESSRSKSSGSRSSPSGRHRSDRSKSRGRFTAENKSVTEKNRTEHKQKSRDRANKDPQTILPVSEFPNRNPVENAKNKIPGEPKVMNCRESREKSTRASSHHDDGRPIEKSHEPFDTKFKGESKIEIHKKKGGSGDPEITTGERDKDFSIKPISESPKKNCVSVGNTKNLKIESFGEPREKTIDCAEKEVTSSEKIENFIDTRDKFILMLENDSEIALSPIANRETDPSGSRSFREEKIENIEKFILDYKDDAIHCSLLGNDLDSSEQKDENNFANSTNSIVDTLSMDIDDLENELETKSEEKALKTNVEVVSIPEKDQNFMIVSKVEKNHTNEKPPSQVSLNNKSKETAIDAEPEKVIATEKSIEKTFEARFVVEKKIVELVKDKKKEIVSKKSQSQDKKCESSASVDKKSGKSTNSIKTLHASSDGKSMDKKKEIDEESSKKMHKKVQKVDEDKQLKVTESIEPITENKESKEKSDNLGISKKLETTKILEKTDDASIEHKCEVSLDEESKNVNLVKICDNKNDKKVENTADSKSNGRVIDEGSRAVDKNPETVQVETSDESIFKSLPPPLPPLPDLMLAPPLPPSPELPSLPPLPPSPPPEEKEPEISSVQKIYTIKTETRKSQAEKIISKQTKNRPRIPCLSIVSLYSRKRRGMVLTDSTSSRTVVTSLKSTEVVEVAKESSVSQKTPKIGSEPVVNLAETKDMETPWKKIESENPSTGSKILEAEEKAAETQSSEERELPEPKEGNKMISKTKNCILEHRKPEINSSEPVAASNVEETQPTDQSTGGSSLTEKNSVENVIKNVHDKVEESRAENETTENCDKILASCTSSKSSERAKRSVLKTIASTTGSTESASSNRKRPLSKEKENQSKPPKQAKIMIISRRRPVQLQDSSTVTTLVPSVHEDSSNNNKTQTFQKNVTPSGRKPRAAES